MDLLLNHIHEGKYVNIEYDNIRFVGFGYGAHLIASYRTFFNPIHILVGYTQCIMKNMRSALLFNGFCFIDDHLKKILIDCLKVLKNRPVDIEDLTYTYFKSHFCTQQVQPGEIEMQKRINPINVEGRKVILKGILGSVNLLQSI